MCSVLVQKYVLREKFLRCKRIPANKVFLNNKKIIFKHLRTFFMSIYSKLKIV